MKLVLLSSELPPGPGGIGNHAYHLALELQRRGWQVTVVAPQDYAREEEIAAWSQRQPFEIVRLRRGSFAFWRGFRWLWRSFFLVLGRRPDLLVASGQRAAWLAGMVARLTGRRLAAVGHGTEFGVRGAPGQSARTASATTAPSCWSRSANIPARSCSTPASSRPGSR